MPLVKFLEARARADHGPPYEAEQVYDLDEAAAARCIARGCAVSADEPAIQADSEESPDDGDAPSYEEASSAEEDGTSGEDQT